MLGHTVIQPPMGTLTLSNNLVGGTPSPVFLFSHILQLFLFETVDRGVPENWNGLWWFSHGRSQQSIWLYVPVHTCEQNRACKLLLSVPGFAEWMLLGSTIQYGFDPVIVATTSGDIDREMRSLSCNQQKPRHRLAVVQPAHGHNKFRRNLLYKMKKILSRIQV